MRSSFFEKRLPTLLGIGTIAVGIVATTFLVKQGAPFVSRASQTHIPQELRIANVSDTSFTVTYITKDPVVGSLSYGSGQSLGESALDDRDKVTKTVRPYTVHYITVDHLKPETPYFFSLASGQETFTNNGTAFTITTASPQPYPSPTNILRGRVLRVDGNPPQAGVAVVSTNETNTFSSLVQPDGNYSIPLRPPTNTSLRLLIIADGLRSNVYLSQEQFVVPTVLLSKNYDFTLSATPSSSSVTSVGFPSLSKTLDAKRSLGVFAQEKQTPTPSPTAAPTPAPTSAPTQPLPPAGNATLFVAVGTVVAMLALSLLLLLLATRTSL